MSQEQMRKAAEDFYKVPFEKCDAFTQRAWEASWKASREGVVIQIRKDLGTETGQPFGDALCLVANSTLSECRAAIEAAGVKVSQ